MVCAMCMWDVGIGLLLVVPSLASWFAISLPKIPECALTFCNVLLCFVHRIWWIMVK